MMLIQGKDFARTTEAKIGHAACDLHATQRGTAFGPDMYPIAAATVYATVGVALDAVWNAGLDKGEQAPITDHWLSVSAKNVKRVSSQGILETTVESIGCIAASGIQLTWMMADRGGYGPSRGPYPCP